MAKARRVTVTLTERQAELLESLVAQEIDMRECFGSPFGTRAMLYSISRAIATATPTPSNPE